MAVHLTTNASLLNGTETFQRAVYTIHSLGGLLPLVEWTFILLPLLFHAFVGIWISRSADYNTDRYKFVGNKRYKWQRWTGLIAFAFLMVHVLHLHGWIHFKPWLDLIGKAGLGQFKPYNAASSLISQLDGFLWPAFYLIGVWACVFHLANGIWTAGITWGLWISPQAQQRATKLSVVLGVLLAVIGTAAWWAAVAPGPEDVAKARAVEDEMFSKALPLGIVYDLPHKRSEPDINERRDREQVIEVPADPDADDPGVGLESAEDEVEE